MLDPAEHIDSNVPEDIRSFSIWFCKTYWINGICDPMYVCNVIAMYLGRGDGMGQFGDGLCDPYAMDDAGRSLLDDSVDRFKAAYGRLYGAYTTCIIDSGQDHMLIYTELAKLRVV